jgi:hypothetical protein
MQFGSFAVALCCRFACFFRFVQRNTVFWMQRPAAAIAVAVAACGYAHLATSVHAAAAAAAAACMLLLPAAAACCSSAELLLLLLPCSSQQGAWLRASPLVSRTDYSGCATPLLLHQC